VDVVLGIQFVAGDNLFAAVDIQVVVGDKPVCCVGYEMCCGACCGG